MEKFLWNLVGFVLIAAMFFGFIFLVITRSYVWLAVLCLTVVLWWLYEKKCPTWVEV